MKQNAIYGSPSTFAIGGYSGTYEVPRYWENCPLYIEVLFHKYLKAGLENSVSYTENFIV